MHWCMNRVFILAHVYHSLNKVVYGNTTFIFLNWIISFLVKADTQTIYWKRFKMYARHVNILSHFGTNLHMMDSDRRNWCIFFLLDAHITSIFAIRCHISSIDKFYILSGALKKCSFTFIGNLNVELCISI